MINPTPNPYCVDKQTSYIALLGKEREIVSECLIDTQDLERVIEAGKWSLSRGRSGTGLYFHVRSNHLGTTLGRFITNAKRGEFVHPENGDALDFRQHNLIVGIGPRDRSVSSRRLVLPVAQDREWVFPATTEKKSRVQERERLAELQREMYQRRREWYQEFMSGKFCQDCGERNARLEWHHRQPALKLFPIAHGVFNQPRERLFEEMDKCDLLCRPCHMNRHKLMRAA